MADVKPFTPRKASEDLPDTHTPGTTYIQVTLKEAEIGEAVSNYIRGMFPIDSPEDMTIQFIAGRSGNGHTANILLPVNPAPVQDAQTPADFVPEYAEAEATAQARNEALPAPEPVVPITDEEAAESQESADANATLDDMIAEGQASAETVVEEEPEAPVSDEESPFIDDSDVVETAAETPEEPEEAQESVLFADAVDTRDEPAPDLTNTTEPEQSTPAPKRTVSDLFGATPTAPTPPAAASAPVPKAKSKNIFDNLG